MGKGGRGDEIVGGGGGGAAREVEGGRESDSGRRERGPYSFTRELSGGMRVKER